MTRALALLAICLAACGCRRDPHLDAYLNILYSQQRALEDRLNDLSHEHSMTVDELAAAKEKNKDLERELGRGDDDRPAAPSRRPRRPDADTLPVPDSDRDESPPTLTPPEIEEGEPFTPTGRRSPEVRLTPANTSAAARSGLNEKKGHGNPADKRITHIVLNPYLTQGHDFNGEPGDDGISLAIEPRNAADEYVALAGKVSIVVIDPEAGEEGRIARWDFEADEVAQRLKSSGEQGLEFKLPWPKAPPTRAQLLVYARYTTPNDERFETSRPKYLLNLPGQFSHRWTPKSSRPVQDLTPDRLDALVERPQRRAEEPPSDADAPAERQASLPDFKRPAPAPPQDKGPEEPPAAAPKRPEWTPYR